MSGRDLDALSALVLLIRVHPEIEDLCLFAGPWASRHEASDAGWASFHIVLKGSCVAEVAGEAPVRMAAGDVLLMPHGSPHVVRDGSGRLAGAPIAVRAGHASRIKSNTAGETKDELVCGRLRFEHASDNFVLAALPAVLVVRTSDATLARLAQLVAMIGEEMHGARQGTAAIVAELATALLAMMLRLHVEQCCHDEGLFRLLAQRQTARLVSALLKAPARNWALDEMADLAGASRATLVRSFKRATGRAPLGFLADLRMRLGRQRIAASTASLAQIASDVGYGSESAFSQAFHRHYGIWPSQVRGSRSVG